MKDYWMIVITGIGVIILFAYVFAHAEVYVIGGDTYTIESPGGGFSSVEIPVSVDLSSVVPAQGWAIGEDAINQKWVTNPPEWTGTQNVAVGIKPLEVDSSSTVPSVSAWNTENSTHNAPITWKRSTGRR